MGWISNWKAKKAESKARAAFAIEHADWESDLAIFKKAYDAFSAAEKGEDSAQNYTVQKSGEVALWSGQGIFHEVGKTPSRYEGSSSGISIPIVKGVRYRVGATRGTLIPGEEYQMDKDQGTVLVTTDRVIFTGSLKTQEWQISKILGAARSADESDFIINVSNRQKSSGVRFDIASGREFSCFLALTMSAAEEGLAAVLKELEKVQKELIGKEPILVLPSTRVAKEIEAPKE
jgi:hypothetical protein